MVRRKEVTAEELQARAEANGYQRRAHREKDRKRDTNRHGKVATGQQDRFLRVYVKWMYLEAKKDCLERGLPIPDIATVREDCLGKGIPAPGIDTVKDFLRFYIASGKGRLHDRPTVDSVNTHAVWFFAGFSRVTGTPIDEEDRSEVFNWVKRTLTDEGLIVNMKRPKNNFGKEDLNELLLTLWTKDDLIFIHERNRIQFTFIFHVYCWTGARLSAFFTGEGLCYKDIELVLKRVPGGGWTLIYKIDQRWVKNNRDPKYISYGAAGKQHAKLLYNDGALLLLMAIADKALFGFNSMDDLWQQEIPRGEDEVILQWNESAKNLPILRKVTMKDGVTKDPMSKWTFHRIHQFTLRNAGYFCGTSIHQIRRYLGKKIDERYTETERSQHITQSDPRIFGQSYVANCSSVDRQAAFLGETAEHDHIDFFQGLRRFREKGLPCNLPAEIEASLAHDPKLLELESQARQLETDEETDPCQVREAKKRVRDYRSSLKAKTFQQYQQDWVRNRRVWKIITRGKESPEDVIKTDFVQNLGLMMPERGRLAEMMATDRPLKQEEMRQAMQDLYSLCIRDFTVLYRPGEEPIDGACPVKCCRLKMESLPKPKRSIHIHECQRRELASILGRLQSELHYCYQCFIWFDDKDKWDDHCQSHLSSITSKRCGSTIYCNTIIRPAYCPFCLNEATLSASSRWQSWTRDRNLWSHLEEHIGKSCWPSSCPHPLCDLQLNDEESFYYHLSDIHSLHRSDQGRKDTMKGNDNLGQSEDTGNQKRKKLEGDTHNRKKQKVRHIEAVPRMDFISWSPESCMSPHNSTVKPSPTPNESCITTEVAASLTDSTVSPSLTLLSPIWSPTNGDYDDDGNDSPNTLDYLEDIIDRDMNELNEDEEARRAELQVNSKETMDIPVVDLTEDNSLPYDDFLSQCITIPSSPCSSMKGASDDDNESLPDLTSGESCLSSEVETCPANTINYNLVELNEDAQTKLRKPRIKLRLNPPKPKILLRLKQTEQASSQENRCRTRKNGRRTKKSASLNDSTTVTGRKRGKRIF